jgi:FkbM family methyltransferase
VIALHELKYCFIRTPFEVPLMRLRHALGYLRRVRSPELREIYLEDERVQKLLRKVVRYNTNCVDVGYHYGSMLSRFCSLAPQGRHVAFEAIPSKVRFLRRKFPEVEIFETAVSDHAGSESFYINLGATGFSGLAKHGSGQFSRIDVACVPLDEAIPRDRAFDLIKVDVEGAELFVFRGASAFLSRDRPAVLFECGPTGPRVFGYNASDLYDLFAANGYSVFFLRDAIENGPPANRASFEAALVYPFKAFNWLAVANERISQVLVNHDARPLSDATLDLL